MKLSSTGKEQITQQALDDLTSFLKDFANTFFALIERGVVTPQPGGYLQGGHAMLITLVIECYADLEALFVGKDESEFDGIVEKFAIENGMMPYAANLLATCLWCLLAKRLDTYNNKETGEQDDDTDNSRRQHDKAKGTIQANRRGGC